MPSPVVATFQFNVENTNILTNTVLKPVGLAVGDLMLAPFSTDGIETLTAPDGTWTNGSASIGTNGTSRWFWKIATASDVAATDFTFNISTIEQSILGMLRITGADGAAPIDVSDSAVGNTATPTCPDVTTTVPDTLLVVWFGADDNDVTQDTGYPPGTTGLWVRATVSGGGFASQGAAHVDQAAIGPTGTNVYTIDAIETWAAFTIAIAPAAAAEVDDPIFFGMNF